MLKKKKKFINQQLNELFKFLRKFTDTDNTVMTIIIHFQVLHPYNQLLASLIPYQNNRRCYHNRSRRIIQLLNCYLQINRI